MREAMEALSVAVQAASGIAIRYRRGPRAESMTATLGRTDYDQATDFGVRRIVSVDFLIDAAAFGEAFGEPEAGDCIEEPRSGTTAYYVVASLDGGPPWRYSDTHRTILRVHTKATGTKPA